MKFPFRPLILIGILTMTACVLHATSRTPAYPDSPQLREGKFQNDVPTPPTGFLKTVRLAWNVLTNKPRDTVPAGTLPVQALTRAELLAAPDRSLFRLGHSTVLLKLRGEFWLTDPVFSDRASPVQWAGPKRSISHRSLWPSCRRSRACCCRTTTTTIWIVRRCSH
jgi:hypothetical protein